eukprot:15448125-Alexandrium_andersonii.AAC.1
MSRHPPQDPDPESDRVSLARSRAAPRVSTGSSAGAPASLVAGGCFGRRQKDKIRGSTPHAA